jgi:5-bromo-4-chloroindolyl phosphate hydrolysis protein
LGVDEGFPKARKFFYTTLNNVHNLLIKFQVVSGGC